METQADAELCIHAFDVAINSLDGNELPSLQRGEVGGVFVTWSSRLENGEGGSYDLRGCLGTLTPVNLGDGVTHYAELAAFHDHRFEPITRADLPLLKVGVSVLHTFEGPPDGIYDWDVGTHGIIINFDHDDENYSATYLPEVPYDQGWTQQETVASLAQKAGFHYTLTPEIISIISLTRYQSSKLSMTYQQYQARIRDR